MRIACLAVAVAVTLVSTHRPASAQASDAIRSNRRWEVLRPAPNTARGNRRALLEASRRFGKWSLEFSGITMDRRLLRDVSRSPGALQALLRERVAQAVDVRDFVFFLDDVLRAKIRGRIDEATVPSGRARLAGILLHPDDVFRSRPRVYGRRKSWLSVDAPPEKTVRFTPTWRPLGAIWTAAYPQPNTEQAHRDALRKAAPQSDLASRLEHLFRQLRLQGAQVELNASVRSRERGYLIYGSFVLSQCRTRGEVARKIRHLCRLRRRHRLDVPILWRHSGGWRATVRAAKKMASAYGVVYATQRGALHSDHYDGRAVDFSATGLPPRLILTSYDGRTSRMFDLSHRSESRDLNLTPRLIRWVEDAYALKKVDADYPHWADARPKMPDETVRSVHSATYRPGSP